MPVTKIASSLSNQLDQTLFVADVRTQISNAKDIVYPMFLFKSLVKALLRLITNKTSVLGSQLG